MIFVSTKTYQFLQKMYPTKDEYFFNIRLNKWVDRVFNAQQYLPGILTEDEVFMYDQIK